MRESMHASSVATQQEFALAGLIGTDQVTVITIDRETPWHPHSPLDVPHSPRQAGGMPVRQMALGEMIEHNEEVMRTGGRFWWVCPEMLHRDAAGENQSPATDAETGDAAGGRQAAPDAENSGPGRSQAAEYSDADAGDGRGDRRGASGSAAGDSRAAGVDAESSGGIRRCPGTGYISTRAHRLLGLVAAELTAAVLDQAQQLASDRAVTAVYVEAADVRKAAETITDVGTRRRIRWQSIDSEGGA
jgi:hypothetical protein